MEEETITPDVEVKDTTEEVADTIGDLIEEAPKKEDKSVPLATLLEIKKEKKALERELQDIKESIKQGATKSEVSSDLASLADKYDVDANFLSELTSIVYSKAKADVETAIQPVLESESKAKIDKALSEHIDNALEGMAEYANVVNKDVIKALAKLPENKNKTFQQLIEETYSKTVTGRKTLESPTPRGGKDVGIDWNKVRDPDYFKQIMANPELKKQYNADITTRVSL